MIHASFSHEDIKPIEEALIALFPAPQLFHTQEEIHDLSEHRAMEVMRATRRMLLFTLLQQEYHEHILDDCGDDLAAATQNWSRLHSAYFDNDGTDFVKHVQAFIEDADALGGCDGEIRLELVSEELADLMYYPET